MFASCVQKVTVTGKSDPVAERDASLFEGDYYVDVVTQNGDSVTAIATKGVVFDTFPTEVNVYTSSPFSQDFLIKKKDQ